ncbi:DUF6238 family protein [Streptomyces sp. MS19]|uniref:DUF6238 family protein n=1 Tax=Streptomyces sp. MS19 TaxID=3385972 RepID=UPI0039A1520F
MTPADRPPSSPATLYLRAATAGIRHHAKALTRTSDGNPPDRHHLDDLHAHIAALLRLLDHLVQVTRPEHPSAGQRLSAARDFLWAATAAVHDSYHRLPPADGSDDGGLPDGPPTVAICHRHLATGHLVRRTSTPTDLTRDHTPG